VRLCTTGRLVFARKLRVNCESGAQEAFHDKVRVQTATLVNDLTLDDPRSRLAAKHVIQQLPPFTILNDMYMRDSKVCLLCDMSGDECNKDKNTVIDMSTYMLEADEHRS
jgi:hypothetical protein